MPGAMTTTASPVEAMQQLGGEDLRGLFGIEGGPEDEEDRPEKKRRVDGPSPAEEEAAIEESCVFGRRTDGDSGARHKKAEARQRQSGRTGVVEPEEGRAVRTAKSPYVPTEQERREHAVIHFPPRSW